MSLTIRVLGSAVLAATMPLAQAAGIPDATGDFLPTFSGSHASADLDVTSVSVTYDIGADVFTFTGTMAGNVGTTTAGFYVWGVNRGAGTAGFAANGLPGVKFDSVMILRPDGTGSIGAATLPAGSVTISGTTITGVVSGSLLPSTGFAKTDYTFNLWPRDGAFAGFAAISDFAPDAVNFTAVPIPVPEPASLALMAGGVAALLLKRRRRG